MREAQCRAGDDAWWRKADSKGGIDDYRSYPAGSAVIVGALE